MPFPLRVPLLAPAGKIRMLLATASAMCSFAMTPLTCAGRDWLPEVTTAIVARRCRNWLMTSNAASDASTTM